MPPLSKYWILNEHLLVFLFCLAVVAGPATAVLFQYDLSHFPDARTYLGMAHFDFVQSAVRRYRVIVPMTAAVLNYLFGGFFSRLAPAYFQGDFALPFSFFMVNSLLTAYFGLLVYRYCLMFGSGRVGALIGALAVLTSRYTVYMAALPIVDALFCVVIMLTLVGLKSKSSSTLLWAIFLGFLAKESFVFVAPLIFFSHLHKVRAVVYVLAAVVIVLSYRYLFDLYFANTVAGAYIADAQHLPNLWSNLPKLFSFYTFNKILMNIGFWFLAPLIVLFFNRQWGRSMISKLDYYLILYLAGVVAQMLLSGSMERMFYLAMPVFCVIVSMAVDELIQLYKPAASRG